MVAEEPVDGKADENFNFSRTIYRMIKPFPVLLDAPPSWFFATGYFSSLVLNHHPNILMLE